MNITRKLLILVTIISHFFQLSAILSRHRIISNYVIEQKDKPLPYDYHIMIDLMQQHHAFTKLYFNDFDHCQHSRDYKKELDQTISSLWHETQRFSTYYRATREYYNNRVPSKIARSIKYYLHVLYQAQRDLTKIRDALLNASHHALTEHSKNRNTKLTLNSTKVLSKLYYMDLISS